MDRPTRDEVVVTVAGEIDAATTPRLHELLRHRLASCARTVVVNMSAVTFIDCAGIELLCECQRRAAIRSISLRLVTCRVADGGTACVDRLIDLLELGRLFARYGSVGEALGA